MLRSLVVIACLVPLPGCLIVVDRDHDVRYYDDDRGRIGVYLDSVDAATASQLGLECPRATLVTGVVDGSPAQQAGVQKHDIITAIDGDFDASPSRVRHAIRGHKSGEPVSLSILRQGKPQTLTVTCR